MKASQPQAARWRLVLLALAVLAVHVWVLGDQQDVEASRPAGLRPLATRVIAVPGPTPAAPPAPSPPAARVSETKTAVARTAIAQPAINSVASAAPSRVARSDRPAIGPVAATAGPEPEPAPAPGADAAATAPPAPAPPQAAPALAFAIPAPVRLRYAVAGRSRGLPWQVEGELLWRHDGSSYQAQLDYSAPLLPSRSQRSTGLITAEGLAPTRFSDKSRSEQAAHFERDKGKVSFSNNAPDAPLLPGAQDRLSVFLQLGAMMAGAPAQFPAGTAITVQTVGTREAEPWVFTVEGDETLQLPGGSLATRKLQRSPRRDYDTRVELWLCPGMDYVPVRIRLTQPNGDFVDQQWSSTDRP